ncbi:MAG: hypothetical protein FJY77_01075 [Candidatus Altiarchaeales archaeon]|nr:hypothetical protein [Candidatus Altiarchaeales archaeon]
MKNKIKTLLELARPRNMAISFLGVIVGMLLASKTSAININAISAAISTMLILGGGNALNDYYDYHADKINRPKRPIPSGRIKRETVKQLSTLMFLAGILVALSINAYCLLLAIANSTILIAYAKYSKKAILLSNTAVSYLSASVFVYGALSIYQTNLFNPTWLGILATLIASSFFMTLSREIIKDMEDVKGDHKMHAITLPIKIGVHKAKNTAILSGLMSIAISLIPLFTKTTGFNTTAYALFIIPANLIFISSYFKTPSKSQKHIVLGMTISLIAFLTGRIL